MFTRQGVLEKASEEQVKFLRLQFTDIFGTLKNIAVTSDDIERVLDGKVSFENSVVDGVINHREQDILLVPDLFTFVIFPWRPREGSVARFICDVVSKNGTPYPGCSRSVLKRVLDEAGRMGFEISVGAEVEFYLFHLDDKGYPTTDTHDNAGFCDLTPYDLGENVRRDMVLTLEETGIDIGFCHHELGPGQHKIALKPDDALATADKLVTLKFIVRTIAQRHGLYASFMPMPLNGMPGSALHLHLYLRYKEQNPATLDEQLVQPGREVGHFIAGILAHTRANTAITNPLINSYKRFANGGLAPTYVAWSSDNRETVLRLVCDGGRFTRVEVRNPDPSCNPYMALAVILKAGLDGIENRLPHPPPLGERAYPNEYSRREVRVARLPRTLEEALRELASDQLARATLGEYIYRIFAREKGEEWERFMAFVHPWELEEYL